LVTAKVAHFVSIFLSNFQPRPTGAAFFCLRRQEEDGAAIDGAQGQARQCLEAGKPQTD
jgi:hypothetical protein